MLFNSLTFLAFFAIVMLAHHLPISWTARKRNLLVASYLFYAAWNPPFIVLLWLSTITDWFAANGIAATRSHGRRRAYLLVSVFVNLGLLAYFKYAEFVLENFVVLLSQVGIAYQPPPLDIVLPLGISFYTFQTLSYTISVYRGDMKPSKTFLDFALFVTFFPQLVAGPIVRAQEFIPQCSSPKRADSQQLGWGLSLLTIGLFQKVILADTLVGPVADLVFGATAGAGSLDAWIGTLAFTCQIFFDFSGYSSCAIGVALCLGFKLPENFRFPYAARGFSDFWSRWHISLSSWFRDFVYIPLGGNRRAEMRIYINLMVTMLLSGLWHGASWNFVVWGGLHGTYVAIERSLRGKLHGRFNLHGPAPRLLSYLATFIVVALTFVFFRAENMGSAVQVFEAMVGDREGSLLSSSQVATVSIVLVLTLGSQIMLRDVDLERFVTRLPLWIRSTSLAMMICALILAPGDDRAFIYFQF